MSSKQPNLTLNKVSDRVLKVHLNKHEKWVRKERGGEKLHLPFTDLSDKDFSGRDLSGADLWGSDLSNTNFSNAILKAASMCLTNLHCADFSNACLADAYLMDCDASYACFKDVDFTNARMKKADLSHSILVRTDLRGASMLGLNLIGAYVHNVIWPYKIPKSVRLEGCNEDVHEFQEYSIEVQVTGTIPVRVIAPSAEAGKQLAAMFAGEYDFGKLTNIIVKT